MKEIFTDKHYANNILVKTGLSDSQELAALTKKVSQELNLNVIELNAIEGYINTLSVRGASVDHIWSSKYFLIILADYLYGIDADGASYRQAVEAMVSHADIQEQALCVKIARDFYPFWINENRLAFDANNKNRIARTSFFYTRTNRPR